MHHQTQTALYKRLLHETCLIVKTNFYIDCHLLSFLYIFLKNVFLDLTSEERQLLLDIRRRKAELLAEITQLKDEIKEISTEIDTMDTEEGAKQKNLAMGKKKFNMDPKKGIEFLILHGLIKETPEEVAQFLYKEEGLNKTAIGDYLGEKNDFNESVLRAFVELHDFTDLILVQALRQFLWSFRLPGEAQKIDRMMETFARRYCQLNPDIFTNPDTCYVLSFAIIMLNTSLHNPSVKDKPSVEQFITMNRGINDGENLPRELLVSLYERYYLLQKLMVIIFKLFITHPPNSPSMEKKQK